MCVPTLLILHCNLCWPPRIVGWGGGGAQLASVWLELPVSRYSLSREGRWGAAGVEEAGEQPPDARGDAQCTWGYSCVQLEAAPGSERNANRRARLAVSFSPRERVGASGMRSCMNDRALLQMQWQLDRRTGRSVSAQHSALKLHQQVAHFKMGIKRTDLKGSRERVTFHHQI